MFSDAFGEISSDEQAPEQTDAERSVILPAATARSRVDEHNEHNNLDDVVSDLPDAHISDFDVSDLDGEVVDLAATTIMQLPPSMIGHHHPEPVERIAVRKWSAGPQVSSPLAMGDAANVTWEGGDDESDDDVNVSLADPTARPRRAALAPTFLSVSAVKAGGFLVDAPALREPVDEPTARSAPTLAPQPGLRDLLDTTLAALLAAQACADANGVPQGLNAHLDKAVDLLSRAIDLVEGD